MPRPVLAVVHATFEPLGRIGDWLAAAGLEIDVRSGGELPKTAGGFGGMVVMGGPQDAVGDCEPFPGERALIRSAVSSGLPYLGVCLGAQLLAAAMGGAVDRGKPGGERGIFEISLRPEAVGDLLLGALPERFDAALWHGDEIVALPEAAVWLASSELCRYQALRVGKRAWGILFHPEADPAIMAGWAASEGRDPELYLPRAIEHDNDSAAQQRWQDLTARWASLVE